MKKITTIALLAALATLVGCCCPKSKQPQEGETNPAWLERGSAKQDIPPVNPIPEQPPIKSEPWTPDLSQYGKAVK